MRGTAAYRTLKAGFKPAVVCPAGAEPLGVKGPRRGDDDNRSGKRRTKGVERLTRPARVFVVVDTNRNLPVARAAG